ncbi:MAG: ComEC/Rec2 family competence protein [Candidatus Doudnabacteria bacterium]|jgi:competence protein ComEC
MSKSRVFIGLVISFAVGVLAASALLIEREQIYFYLTTVIAIFIFCYLKSHQAGAILALFLFTLGLGALRLQIATVDSQYTQLFGQKQKMEGFIVQEPDIRDNRQLLYFLPQGSDQRILITTTLVQEFFYGDKVLAEGKIMEPKSFEDFDYKGYLERHNVYAQMSYPKVLILKSHQLNWGLENLLKVKATLIKRLAQVYKEPQNSLLLGILIGAKKTLPANIVENFNITGTSHIIAVSGYNITIMILALAVLSRFFGRRFSFWFTSAIIIAFVLITGASASVIRAAVMGFLLLVSSNIGRQYSVAPALFFAGGIMMLINPKILFWDIGFQLSFAATLGIVYFMPELNRATAGWPESWGIKTILLTTLSATFATLPLVLYNFERLSLSALPVNILILPFVPATMLFGFLSLLPGVGPGFAFIGNLLLGYILKVTEWFARIPYSSMNFKISVYVFWLLMGVVLGLYALIYRWNNRQAEQLKPLEVYDKIAEMEED